MPPREPSADNSPARAFFDIALFAPLGFVLTVGEAIPELARKGRSRLEPPLGAARTVGELAVGQGRQRLRGVIPGRSGQPLQGGIPNLFKGGIPNPFKGGVPNPFKGGVPDAVKGSVANLFKDGLPFGLLKGFPLGPFGPPAARRSAAYPASSANGQRHAEGNGPVPSSPRDRTGRPGGPVGGAGADVPPGSERPVRPVVRRPPDVESAGGHTPTSPGRTNRTGRSSRGALVAGDLAIPSYDALSASQVVQRLAGLSPEEIRAVRAYEAATRGRRTILAKADQLLS